MMVIPYLISQLVGGVLGAAMSKVDPLIDLYKLSKVLSNCFRVRNYIS